MGSPIIIGLRADSKSRGFFGERMRTDVSRETSRLTGMRTAPTSRAGTLRRPRIRIGNPRASPGGGRRGRASRGAPVGEGASRGGGRPPRSARTGSRRHRPQKAGKRGGRERTLCTIIGACRRRRGGKHPVGRNGEGEESCIARILFHAQGNDPSQGARRRGSHPAPPPPTRTDVSRETSRLTGMRAAPRAGRAARRQPRTGDWEPARQPGGCSLMFVETRHGKDIKAERGKKTGSRERPTMP